MRVFCLERECKLRGSIEDVWDFFSSPANLKKITPPYMGFDIISAGSDKPMFPGMLIQYKVNPMFNIPITWVTEITHCETGSYFVDEQRFGPYKFWHHLHTFEETNDGILMKDKVHYSIGFGFFGSLLNRWIIREKLAEIFDYRNRVVSEVFSHGLVNV